LTSTATISSSLMVLTTSSFHTESLRKKYHHHSKPDDAGPFGFFRAALNVGALIECVKNAVPTNATANGNKRAASPLSFNGPAKRLKLSDTTSLAQKVVPLFSHTFTIQYTSGPAEDEEGEVVMDVDDPINANWVQEEQTLLALLDELYGSSASRRPLDLGPIATGMHKHRLCACLSPASTTDDFLLLIPSLFSELDANNYDFTSPGVEDLAVAAYVLMLERRAEIDLSLHLISLAPSSHDSPLELSFRLQVELSVSLRVPQVFHLDYQLGPKVKMLEIEDAQRRLLTHVFPPSACVPPAYDGETNIPFLYSVLRPAPKLPSVLADKHMQPAKLRPTLLPFQRRSVGWLLEHEGKVVDDSGAIVRAADMAVPSKPQPLMFWEDIKLDSGETWYIHRLTGALSPNIPVAGDIAPGAILAEEPGLGKTLECISLILLNPAGPQRNPSVYRWDYEAKVQVKEIKVLFSSSFD
jgi:E3 ubiquitin-protein ligase SHPRH